MKDLNAAPHDTNQHQTQSDAPKPEGLDESGSNDASAKDNASNGVAEETLTNGTIRQESTTLNTPDIETRLEELSIERQSLQAEVKSLRKSLEEIQEKHEKETSTLRSELEDAQRGKDHAETQYRNLLGKLNTIRSQLGERLKADAVGHFSDNGSGLYIDWFYRKNCLKRKYKSRNSKGTTRL